MKLKATFLGILLVLSNHVSGQNDLQTNAKAGFLDVEALIDIAPLQPEVNIFLPSFLLASLVQDLEQEDIALQEALQGIKSIRVLVVRRNEANAEALATAVSKLRKELEGNWMSVIHLPEEQVGFYTQSDPSGQAMAGLAGLIAQGEEVVVLNLMGSVSLGKVLAFANTMEDFDLEALMERFGTEQAEEEQ